MSGPESLYIDCAGREIHVSQWGDKGRPPLILWHGLARTGRDFDVLAQALEAGYFILCPDTLGRGLSQWAADPETEYSLANYGRIAGAILDHFEIDTVRWIGTSMGGALGMYLAGGEWQQRISHLLINDVGPEVAPEAVERILTYAGNPAVFDTLMELEQYLRTIYQTFGHLSDREWRRMAESSFRRTDEGRITLHYDPNMVQQFVHQPGESDLWSSYDAIKAKTLLLRGKNSDVLLPQWSQQMHERGPCCEVVEIEDCGHAPPLNNALQVELVQGFLR